jgi:hypothetical protein
VATFADYVATLDRLPTNAAVIAQSAWTIRILPTGSVTATKRAPTSDEHVARELHDELERLLGDSDPISRVVHLQVIPVEGSAPQQPHAPLSFRALDDDTFTAYITNPVSHLDEIYSKPSSSTGVATDPSTSKTPAATNGNKQSEAAPASGSEKAQVIEKGLPALDLPDKLWDYIDVRQRPNLAKKTVERLCEARLAYAARAGWVVSPELELLDLVARTIDDPKRTTTQNKAGELLEFRIQLASVEAALAQEDVNLKKELIKQQGKVTAILDEALKQAVAWRDLAKTGRHVLIGLTLFGVVVVSLLTYLLFGDNRLDVWAYPVAVFALAVFALSPAALLIIERPLKGIDEWMPGAKPDAGQAQQSKGGGAAAESGSQNSKAGTAASSK